MLWISSTNNMNNCSVKVNYNFLQHVTIIKHILSIGKVFQSFLPCYISQLTRVLCIQSLSTTGNNFSPLSLAF